MDFFLQFDVNFFSIMLLLVLYVTIKLRREACGTSSHLFFKLLWVTLYLLVLEVLSWAFDRVEGQYFLNYLFNMLFALSTSLITCIWASYMDYHIFGSYERLRKRWFYMQPFILNGIGLIINIFVPFIFTVSSDNVYSRLPMMMILPLINLIVFAYICVLAFKNRHKIQREIVLVILLYIFMPAIAAFVQVKIFGIFILWPTMAVTVVLTYIFLETISTSKDYLTGLLSRHRIDDYLEYMLDKKKSFILVMIDLDKFKEINDTHGHLCGDLALKMYAETLQHHFSKEKVVGRYAGDEFVLILDKTKEDQLVHKLDQIKLSMKELIDKGLLQFDVAFSYGYYVYDGMEDLNYEEIMNHVDQRMYNNKYKRQA